MFHARCDDDGAADGVLRDGVAFLRVRGNHVQGLQGEGAQGRFTLPRDQQHVGGEIGCHRLRKGGNGDDRADAGVCCGGADDDVGGHGMAQKRDGAGPAFRLPRGGDDVPRLFDQTHRGAFDHGDIARHRLRVAAMPVEIEGPDAVARLRQGQGITLHHLARSGEAMGDDDQGAVCLGQGGAGDGSSGDVLGLQDQAAARGFELPDRQQRDNQAQQHGAPPPEGHAPTAGRIPLAPSRHGISPALGRGPHPSGGAFRGWRGPDRERSTRR